MNLSHIVARIWDYDFDGTIYAIEPWTEDASAIVATEPEVGGLPYEAVEAGMKYFLEVSVVKEFIEDWVTSLGYEPGASAACNRLIQYAKSDA